MPFKFSIDKRILIEDTFRAMRFTLSKMKRSLCTIDMAGQTMKMIKHDFFENLAKIVKGKNNQRTNGPVNAHLIYWPIVKHKTNKTCKIYVEEMILAFNTRIPS